MKFGVFDHLDHSSRLFTKSNWVAFVGVILALSGVEAIANLTGVLKLDEGANVEQPVVAKTARKAIMPVAVEVVLGTALLGWAMLSLPQELTPDIKKNYDVMLNYQSTSFHDALYIRDLFGLKRAPEFDNWLVQAGLADASFRLAGNAGLLPDFASRLIEANASKFRTVATDPAS